MEQVDGDQEQSPASRKKQVIRSRSTVIRGSPLHPFRVTLVFLPTPKLNHFYIYIN